MTARAQKILVWWGVIFLLLYGLAWALLIKTVPPIPANWTTQQVAQFYRDNGTSIRIGALITSWTAGFMVPLAVAISVQMARLEKGVPIWSILQFAGGIMMSFLLVLPPLFWGVTAWDSMRPAEVTKAFHELSWLTMTTTDQYFIFQMVAMVVISLRRSDVPFSAFPRWYGYFTAWCAVIFEAGALAFGFRTGPFAWNGLFVFWLPLILFGVWIFLTCFLLLRVIERQRKAGLCE